MWRAAGGSEGRVALNAAGPPRRSLLRQRQRPPLPLTANRPLQVMWGWMTSTSWRERPCTGLCRTQEHLWGGSCALLLRVSNYRLEILYGLCLAAKRAPGIRIYRLDDSNTGRSFF